MTNDTYSIYEITRVDGKRYIGCTKRWPERLKEHRRSKRFATGIKEYRVFFQTRIRKLAEMMETYWCEKLNPELNRHQ